MYTLVAANKQQDIRYDRDNPLLVYKWKSRSSFCSFHKQFLRVFVVARFVPRGNHRVSFEKREIRIMPDDDCQKGDACDGYNMSPATTDEFQRALGGETHNARSSVEQPTAVPA